MSRSRIAALVVVAAGSILAIEAMAWRSQRIQGRPLSERSLERIRGNSPNYTALNGVDYCSGNNLAEGQKASYQCPGNPGSPCILCDDQPAGLSGLYNELVYQNIQPSGGADVSCSFLTRYSSTCIRDSSGAYRCDGENKVNTGENCSGTYPPFQDQWIGKAQPSDSTISSLDLYATR